MKMIQSSYNNSKEIHTVNKYTTLSLFALFLAVYMILSPFFGEKMDVVRHNSISKAQAIAYQVAAMTNKKLTINQDALSAGRSPASFGEQAAQIGVISQNDFGQPYHYEISKIAGKIKITVWSKQDFTDKTEVLIPSEKL